MVVVDGLVAALIAPVCAACKRPLERPTVSAVCLPCWRSIAAIAAPFCDGCGAPLQSWRILSIAERRCPRCRRRGGEISIARAVGTYEGTLRLLLHAFKYERRRSIARRLAALMRRHGEDVLHGADALVPVPLHRSRLRTRGFNQAEDLAQHLDLPVARVLRRVRATTSQTDLPASRRHANVRGAFALTRRAEVEGRRLVLIDDVSTTGATLEACARVLRAAGAAEVRALVAARATVKVQ